MKKLWSVILVAVLLLTFASCGSGSSQEEMFIGRAQALINEKDYTGAKDVLTNALTQYPENEQLKNLLTSVETTLEFSKVPTEEQVLIRFNEMNDLGDKWFSDIGFERAAELSTITIQDDSGESYLIDTANLITKSGINSTDDIYALFSNYCSKETVKDLYEEWVHFADYEDKAYVIIDEGGGCFKEKKDCEVKKISDTDFEVTYLLIENYADYYDCSVHYTKGETIYQFGKVTKTISEKYKGIELGDYIINTKSDPLIMHDTPKSGTENIGTIPKGTKVTVTNSVYGWAYISYNSVSGWVSSDYLKPYVKSESSGNSNGGNSNGDVVNDLVNAGVNLAGGIINSIF